MSTKRRLKGAWMSAVPLIALGAMMIPGSACDKLEDAQSGLCCEDFQVGADLSGANFGVDAEVAASFNVFAQAAADVGAIASASVSDIEVACRGVAIDFGATKEQQKTAASSADASARVKAWCALAVSSFEAAFEANGKFAAAGKLTVAVVPPECSASVSATADCSAKCTVSGECDVKANPPTCEGGKMEVSCKGGCTAQAGATVACQGSCTGGCKGSCTASGGVAVTCDGKCEGECTAAGSGGGSGIQADGSCKGKCKGTCTMRAEAPAVQCEGSCNGSCSAACKAEAGASVKCDGKCDGEFEPISCKGGELKASCDVDAECDANCSASASAKASCTPPRVDVVLTGQGSAALDASAAAEFNAAVESLKVNLALIAKVRVRAEAAAKVVANVVANVEAGGAAFLDPGKLGVSGAACILKIGEAFATAGEQLKASGEATVSIATAFKIGG